MTMAVENRVLVVGTGLQGKAVIHDLDGSPLIGEVVAADHDLEGARRFAAVTLSISLRTRTWPVSALPTSSTAYSPRASVLL